MLSTLKHFLSMGGYAAYVWPAYGSVFIYMLAQAFYPWQRWRKLKNQTTPNTRRYQHER